MAFDYFHTRKPPAPLKAKVGDRVAYARYFLKAIGSSATDEAWFRRGTVTEIRDRIAYVHWDGDDEPVAVGLTNLAHPGPNLAFCE